MGAKNERVQMDNKTFSNVVLFDFVDALDAKLNELHMTRREFAAKLNVSEGRISQVFNKPANFTMDKIVKWARTLGMKE